MDEHTLKSADYAIWEEHLEALEVFLACSRQWRVVSGFGGSRPQGLDASALRSTMQMLGVKDQRNMLFQVQEIESGALEILNE